MRSATLTALFVLLAGCSEFVDRPCDGEACQEAGATECTEDGRRVVCAQAGEECLVWSAPTPCPKSGDRCTGAGNCGHDACEQSGKLQCSGADAFALCEPGADGFLAWSAVESCGSGEACVEPVGCVDSLCEPEGKTECLTTTQLRVCEKAAQEVLLWSGPKSCPEAELCVAGECGTHACEEGQQECASLSATRACVLGRSGFRVWGEPTGCPAGESCAQAVCGKHECGPKGQKACEGEQSVIVCQAGPGGFLVWGVPEPCPDGLVCGPEGQCGQHECGPEGLGECTIGGAARFCELQADGFLAWGAPEPCAEGSVCVEGECRAHECFAQGVLQCTSDTQVQKCGLTESGQLVWLEPVKCPGLGTKCKSQGVCGKDGCPGGGATQCAPSGGVQTCSEAPSGFLSWGAAVPCSEVTVCKGGVCGADVCTIGEVKCLGGELASCALTPGGFLGFGVPEPCPEGQTCLGPGLCVQAGEIEISDEPVLGRPSVDVLPTGGFAVTWTGTDAGSFPVMLRRFDETGSPLEPAKNLSGAVGITQPYPTVAAIPSAGEVAVVVGWLSASEGVLRLMRLETLDTTGAVSLSVTPSKTLPSEPFPTVVALEGGTVALARAEGPISPANQSVLSSKSDGAIGVASAVELAAQTNMVVHGLDAASISWGGAVLVWIVETQANPGLSATDGLRIRGIGAGGNPVGILAQIPVAQPDPARPAIAIGSGNQMMVVFDVGLGSAMGASIQGQRVQADGKPQGGLMQVNGFVEGDQTWPDVVSLPDGRWYAVWQGPDDDGTGVYGRAITADGVMPLVEELLNTSPKGKQTGPRLAVFADGRVLAVWRDGVGIQSRLRARFLVP